jgi:starch phosphorylase
MNTKVTTFPTAPAQQPDTREPVDDRVAMSVDDRVAMNKESLKHAFLDNLFYIQGKFPALATKTDYYMALAYAVRDRMLQRWISTAAAYTTQGSRTVAYLSAEFLMGPHLGNNLINLGIYDTAKTAVAELGLDLEELLAHEDEPGLGNGGLGRLAACFIDSLATLEVPALGYGIRYEFGIFQQEIVDGWQVEKTDKWLRWGNPWEIARPEWGCDVSPSTSARSIAAIITARSIRRWRAKISPRCSTRTTNK